MKKIITLFMALLLLAGEWTPAMAAPGMSRSTRHSLCINGIESPEEFGGRIKAAIAADPKGDRRIRNCRITPNDLLVLYKDAGPGTPKTLGGLPGYFQAGWTLEKPEPGVKLWSSCKDDSGRVIVRCFAREPHAKSLRDPSRPEKVWVKGDQRLFEDCGNVRVQRDVPKDQCIYLNVYLKKDDELRVIHDQAPAPPAGLRECLALWKAGSGEWSTTLLDECPRTNCVQGSDWFKTLSFKAETEGTYVIRLPATVLGRFRLCVIRPDGRQTMSSYVYRRSFRLSHAFVGYKGYTVPPAEWPGLMHTWLFTDGRID